MTWHRLIYIFVFFSGVSIYTLYDQYEAFFLLVLICVLPFISLLLLLLGRFFLRVDLSNTVIVGTYGETINLPLFVMQRMIFLFMDVYVKIQEKTETGQIMAEQLLSINQSFFAAEPVHYACRLKYCGRVAVSIGFVKMYDLLGLFSCRKNSSGTNVILVLPRLYKSFAAVTVDDKKLFNIGNGSEMYGMKLYQQGDNGRYIHWKASIAHDEIYVKEFYQQSESGSILFFDVTELADKDSRNAVYEVFYVIGAQLLNKYGGFTFAYALADDRAKFSNINNMADFDRAIIEYIKIEHDFSQLINLKAISSTIKQQYSNIFYVTDAIEESIINTCSKLYSHMTVIFIGVDCTQICGKGIFINKNDLTNSLSEVWRL